MGPVVSLTKKTLMSAPRDRRTDCVCWLKRAAASDPIELGRRRA